MAIPYPIASQSESMHPAGDIFENRFVRKFFRGENEFTVMSVAAGTFMGGVRVLTATGGPGTTRAFEMFPTWAGARLPNVYAFTARGVGSPLTLYRLIIL